MVKKSKGVFCVCGRQYELVFTQLKEYWYGERVFFPKGNMKRDQVCRTCKIQLYEKVSPSKTHLDSQP